MYDTGPERIALAGVSVDSISLDEAIARVMRLAADGGSHFVVTPNVDHLVLLRRDEELRAAYGAAAMVVADGVPLLHLARLKGTPLSGRVNGTDLMFGVCEAAARAAVPVAIVGGAPGVGELARRRLAARYPGFDAAVHVPPAGFAPDGDARDEIVAFLRHSGVRVVFLCLGSPKQERLAHSLQRDLEDVVFLCVGSAVDFAAGTVRRAPRWMQRSGLEWLFRLAREPGRLWRRYLVRDLQFFAIAARELTSRRLPESAEAA